MAQVFGVGAYGDEEFVEGHKGVSGDEEGCALEGCLCRRLRMGGGGLLVIDSGFAA
jgi:hypothetical protein